MIPQPSTDSHLLKEHQFYSSDSPQEEQQLPQDLLNQQEQPQQLQILDILKQIIKFDQSNLISFDNLLRLFIIISLVFFMLSFINSYLKKRKRSKLINSSSSSSLNNHHGLKEKKNIINLV